MPPFHLRPRRRQRSLGVPLSVLLAAIGACGDDPAAPRPVVTPEGALLTATADRADIVRGDTAFVTYRLINTRDTAITISFTGCRLMVVAYTSRGEAVIDGADNCVAAGGDLTLPPSDTFAVRVPFTGVVRRDDGSTFQYPAGSYALAGLLTRTIHNPYEGLISSPRVQVSVRDP